jgi:hypothetical protein
MNEVRAEHLGAVAGAQVLGDQPQDVKDRAAHNLATELARTWLTDGLLPRDGDGDQRPSHDEPAPPTTDHTDGTDGTDGPVTGNDPDTGALSRALATALAPTLGEIGRNQALYSHPAQHPAVRLRGPHSSHMGNRTPNQLSEVEWRKLPERIRDNTLKQRVLTSLDPQTLSETDEPLLRSLAQAGRQIADIAQAGPLDDVGVLEHLGRRDPETRTRYWDIQDQRDRSLGEAVRNVLQAHNEHRPKTSEDNRQGPATPAEGAINPGPGRPQGIQQLLESHEGVAIGRTREDGSLWHALAANMADLRVDTIYLESIRGDSYQADLNEYLSPRSSGKIPARLQEFINRDENNGIQALLEAAREHNVRVVGVDGRPARTPRTPQSAHPEGDPAFHRAAAMNTYAAGLIHDDRQQRPQNSRYLVELNPAHIGTHRGPDRTVNVLGSVFIPGEEFPGVDNLLGIPGVARANADLFQNSVPHPVAAPEPPAGASRSETTQDRPPAHRNTNSTSAGKPLIAAMANTDDSMTNGLRAILEGRFNRLLKQIPSSPSTTGPEQHVVRNAALADPAIQSLHQNLTSYDPNTNLPGLFNTWWQNHSLSAEPPAEGGRAPVVRLTASGDSRTTAGADSSHRTDADATDHNRSVVDDGERRPADIQQGPIGKDKGPHYSDDPRNVDNHSHSRTARAPGEPAHIQKSTSARTHTGDNDQLRTADGGASLAEKVRARVGPRIPLVLDRLGLEKVVTSAFTDFKNEVAISQEAHNPTSSSEKLSAQECLELLRALGRRLFPQGVAPAGRAMDDMAFGVRPVESSLALGDWKAVGSWREVAAAVADSGPGSTAFVLARRPSRIGHAFAAHALPTGHNERESEIVWIDLQSPPGHRISDAFPTIAPIEARAIIINHEARVADGTLSHLIESSSLAQALADRSTVRQYGAISMEVEFYQHLGQTKQAGIRYNDVVATHRSGSEIRVDTQTFWKVGDSLYLSLDDAIEAGHKSAKSVNFYVPEFIPSPAQLHSGEQRRLHPDSFIDLADQTHDRINVEKPETLGNIFQERDGWEVSPAFADRLINPAPLGADQASPYTQFTVGVPVDHLISLLHLVEAQGKEITDPALFSASREFGRILAEWFIEDHYGQRLKPSEIHLLSWHPWVREVWGFGWLAFNHVAAAPFRNEFRTTSLIKNRLPAASRNPLGEIRAALQPATRSFLTNNFDRIRPLFTRSLSEVFEAHRPGSAPKNPDLLLDAPLQHYSHDVDDYLKYAIYGKTETVAAVSQAAGVGMSSDSRYETLEKISGVPLALLELRQFGAHGGIMSQGERNAHFREISAMAQSGFGDRQPWVRPEHLKDMTRRILGHQNLSQVAPLFEIVSHVQKNDVSGTSLQSAIDGRQVMSLARSLSDIALDGGSLPDPALTQLRNLIGIGQRALTEGTSLPNSVSWQSLQNAIASAQAIVKPRRALPTLPSAMTPPVHRSTTVGQGQEQSGAGRLHPRPGGVPLNELTARDPDGGLPDFPTTVFLPEPDPGVGAIPERQPVPPADRVPGPAGPIRKSIPVDDLVVREVYSELARQQGSPFTHDRLLAVAARVTERGDAGSRELGRAIEKIAEEIGQKHPADRTVLDRAVADLARLVADQGSYTDPTSDSLGTPHTPS